MMSQYESNIVSHSARLKEGLEKLNSNPTLLTILVIDEIGVVRGTLTDGDVRRFLLAGGDLSSPIVEVMQRDFKFLEKGELDYGKIVQFKEAGIYHVPVLDEDGKIADFLNLKEQRAFLPIDVVVMAGGKGMRLRPLTENTPKPLLPVGGEPILTKNLKRYADFGMKNVFLSVNYLGEQIRSTYADGSAFGLNINYVQEDSPMGTMGSIRLVHSFEKDYVLLMNSDLLTDIDFEQMFLHASQSSADLVVATIPYDVNIPYAVVETSENRILSFQEKPTYTYFSNAGIYLFKKELLDIIPPSGEYHATDFLNALLQMSKSVEQFPIRSYWLDIGNHADYEKANQDVQQLNL